MAGASEDEVMAAKPMLGWAVGVTAERRAEEEIHLLGSAGARALHGPVATTFPVAQASDVADLPWDLPHAHGPARRLVAAIAEGAIDAVTFTSPPSVWNFVALASAEGRIEAVRDALAGPVRGVSIGPMCTAAIVDAGFPPPIEPASPRLDAMVRALASHAVRRRGVRVGGVELLLDATHPVIDGTVVDMGARERSVLDALAHRPGAVVSKTALGQQVWGRSTGLHTVEVTVGRLRARLAAACGDALSIDTVPRRGYRLVGTRNDHAAPPGQRRGVG